jgi:N-acetylmuramoyl-L-alanine amidase
MDAKLRIVMSSGHGLHIRGAEGIIDEVDEARRVVEEVAKYLRRLGVDVVTYHDDVSNDQQENLNRIVDFHNAQGPHDIDASVHFNAYLPEGQTTDEPKGCEVFYTTADALAIDLSATMAYTAGFIDRGGKHTDDLFFLNNTAAPAVLIEVCFVDSQADVDLYHEHFDELCLAIAEVLAGKDLTVAEAGEKERDRLEINVAITEVGKCSWFGGPADTGVDPDEGLAFFYEYEDAPHLFLDEQPPGTSGLARRLDPSKPYIACRWDYEITPKTMLADPTLRAFVRSPKTGRQALAWPADWGPHEDTGRVADLSPGLMVALGIGTDDTVEVIYPAPALIG